MKSLKHVTLDFKKIVEAKTIDLDKMGWSSYVDDEVAIKYVQTFALQEYGKKIDRDTAFMFMCIIGDVLDATIHNDRDNIQA
jgi:hypothetical protein